MKKLLLASLIGITTLASAAHAADEKEGGFMVGVKTGKMKIDVDGVDDPNGHGFLVGYRSSQGFGVEFEHTNSESDFDIFGTVGDLEMETNALYVTYRTSGNFYGKVKAGLLSEEVTLDDGFFSVSEDDSGLSFGFGGGYNFGRIALEAEYTIIEEDVDYLSIGVNLNF